MVAPNCSRLCPNRPISPSVDRKRAQIGEARPHLSEFVPTLAILPNIAPIWWKSTKESLKWSVSHKTWTPSPEMVRSRNKIRHIGPTKGIGQDRPKMAESGPNLPKIAQSKSCARSGRIRQELADWPRSPKSGRDRARTGQCHCKVAEIVQELVKIAQHSSASCQKRPNSPTIGGWTKARPLCVTMYLD